MTLSIVIIPFRALHGAEPYGLLEVAYGFVLFKKKLCFFLFTRMLGIEV